MSKFVLKRSEKKFTTTKKLFSQQFKVHFHWMRAESRMNFIDLNCLFLKLFIAAVAVEACFLVHAFSASWKSGLDQQAKPCAGLRKSRKIFIGSNFFSLLPFYPTGLCECQLHMCIFQCPPTGLIGSRKNFFMRAKLLLF